MARLIVSYDLSKPEKDYERLFQYLRSFSWVKPLKSFWVLETEKSASQVRDEIKIYVDLDDKVFIADIGFYWASWNLPREVINWLNIRK